MIENRTTYASKAETYQLDPAKVFEVVEDLNTYRHFAVLQTQKDNPDFEVPPSGWEGENRTLTLHTSAEVHHSTLAGFNLAKLILTEDNSKLTLNVNAHPRVVIPSDDLHAIASKYALEK